ncbi:MAG: roadblock/LC7 domain-containing protein [Acidithiobacillus sp.]|nr:roadblock/LC7 domain-containing protein [Acidithiobacillus sp.]
MSPEKFQSLSSRIHAAVANVRGIALISSDGAILHYEGEKVADERLMGVAGAAVMRVAELVGDGLAECATQEIIIRCQKHVALFLPQSADTLLMVVFPADANAHGLGQQIMALDG